MSTSPERVAEALRASLKETERLRQQNRRLRDAAAEPIAIVGMSCRYPGGADSPDALWRLLAAGTDAISGFPVDRGWDLESIFDPDLERFGASYTREGGFLGDAAEFDREFFGISRREALGMDPQQRLLLEASWEALEDAGVDPGALRGTRTGVFTGAMYHDYGWGLSPAQESAAYLPTGGSSSLVSGRIAYTLGLEGPAMSIDTACSSSLVSLHLATRALRAGECSLALAGGATVYSTLGVFIQFSGQRALSPDGRCKAFSDAADGAGFSEGAGMLLLERLSEAERNGHPVLATIRGSAVNQDGASNGITAPNGPSQERVIRQALEDARLAAAEIDAVEAHGTGTALGDPIEASALLATYGAERPDGRPLRLGSIKSNIGHPQAAAGVAGVIKMVLALRESELPKTLHVEQPSTKIDWSGGAIELLAEPAPWQPNGQPRRAAISSFGATGTNAHLILEEAPAAPPSPSGEAMEGEAPPAAAPPLPGPVLWPLSAKTEPALREAAGRLAARLREDPGIAPLDAGFSLASGRAAFERRAVVVGQGREELLGGLDRLERGEPGEGVVRGEATQRGKLALLFPGHGSQWQGMALGLLDSSLPFAGHIGDCDKALAPFVDWSLADVLRDPSGAWLERLDVVQPALFAVMASLAKLWQELGVKPSAVVGHSLGESVAAYISGGLSLEDATRLVMARSRLISRLLGKGGLASVSLSVELLESRLAEDGGGIEIAAVNGPGSAIVSADSEALERFLGQCEAEGTWARRLPTSMASHSRHVEVLREDFLEALAPLAPRSGEIPFHSTVTCEVLDTAELGPEYWYRNLRQTVLLEPVVRELVADGYRTLLEVGPHPVLSVGLQETVEASAEDPGSVAVIGTLRRDEDDRERFALSLAEAHVAGAGVDWDALFAGTGANRVSLPTYPFQRERFWLSAESGLGDVGAAGLVATEHPLLGAAIADPEGEGIAFTGRISLASHPWLADHALAGTVLFPGTGFVELALAVGGERGCETLEELTLQAPLILAEGDATVLHVVVGEPLSEGRRELAIHSRRSGEEEGWTCHARGTLSPATADAPERIEDWPPRAAQPLDVQLAYERLAEAGFEYGPAFQGLTAAWNDGDVLYAEVSLPAEQAEEAGRFGLHPALLDAAGHAAIDFALSAAGEDGAVGEAAVPFSWRGVSLHAQGVPALRLRLTPDAEGGNGLTGFDRSGAAVVSVESVVMRPVDPAMLRAAARRRLPLHRLEWAGVDAGPAEQAEAPGLAILGEAEIEGLDAEPYADLAALSEAIAAGAPAPGVILVEAKAKGREEGLPQSAHTATAELLELAQAFLATEALAESRLCLLSEGAVAVAEGESPELAIAPLWGLLRSARSEHPGRFALLDSDGSEASSAALGAALAAGADEPQLALREAELLAPRLARVEATEAPATQIDPQRTVLITGATGAIGALLARHLVAEHGARQLLLVSRSGPEAQGAEQLQAELQELGATVRIAACDVAERGQLEELLDSVDPAHPLGAVFHSAGVLDDGMLESLDAERLAAVMRPKADAAWHLHELTAAADLDAFVLFSSIMGVLGGAGQANYAAANAFLDALAAQRRSLGLPAASLDWGGWAQESGMLEDSQGAAALARLAEQIRERVGLAPMPPEQGLALLDAALALPEEPQLAPVAFDGAVLRSQAAAGTLPAVLRGLAPVPVSRAAGQGALAERLAAVPEAEREALALDLVRGHVAAVLGHSSAAEVDPDTAFRDLGFDSLAAVELRNRLVADSGLRLAPTIVFDYPSPTSLAGHLHGEAVGEAGGLPVARPATASAEPIAIVGMACRYPGGVGSPKQLWELLEAGTDAISGFPEDRGWDLERLYHPEPGRPGQSYAREGGFVYDSAEFDPGFFGISPREALAMDPQERALLEACWEALEDGGVDPQRLRGSQAGVFAGVMYQDYGSVDYGMGPGMTSSGVSGRVAYTLGLEGPAMTVDTACSSSLVAMHLAAQALRGGECSLALAGGVTVLSTPTIFAFFSMQRGLSVDGRCKAFAESADGTGIAEGTGVVLLERLADAERNGHRVLATIRGSAVNQDGASNGFSAPNGPSQERVIRQALANARLGPQDVDAVEAHGTGTALGDPIEAGALLATYGQDRERPLWLGSLKSNIGHTQAAAGVGGVIKSVVAMREGVLPRTLHVAEPSSKVDWEAGEIELLAEPRPWERAGRPRRAGVSSFGASGTNAHLILEEGPVGDSGAAAGDAEAPARPRALPGPHLLPLSAKTEAALREVAGRLHAHLAENEEVGPDDAAYSLATTRVALEHRAVVVGSDRDELLRGLAAVRGDEAGAGIARGRARKDGKLAYLFTGQGSQRAGMGQELYETYPAFAAAFDQACEQLDPQLGISLREVVFDRSEEVAGQLDQTSYAQPALFAIEVALFRLLESFGLAPDLLAGHSIGELSAAHLAGVFSLADASLLVAARGRLMGELPSGGAMLAIQAGEQEVTAAIEGSESLLTIAAVNGPASVVLSGDGQAIAAAQEHWQAAGRKTKRLAVSHAFHSPLIDPMLEEFGAIAGGLAYGEPRIPIVSNLTGQLLAAEQAMDPAYWVSHARQPVRFADAVRTLREQGATTFLELGPAPALTAMAEECTEAEDADAGARPAFAPTLRAGQPEPATLALAAAGAHAQGADLDWETFFAAATVERVPLPTYPFQRSRYWLDSSGGAGDPVSAGQAAAEHPLLGASIPLAGSAEVLLTGRIARRTHPWLADHALGGVALLPGTALVELALWAGGEVGAETLEELALQAPLVLPEQGGVQLQVSAASPDEAGRREVAIHSRPEAGEDFEAGEWTCHAQGILAPQPPTATETLGSWPPAGAEPLDVDELYERLADHGVEYGPAFRCVRAAWRLGGELLAEVSLPEEQAQEARRFGLHPALFDATGHVGVDLALAADGAEGPDALALPFAWRGVRIASPGASTLRVRVNPAGDGPGLLAFDEAGDLAVAVDSLALRPLDLAQLPRASRRLPLHRVEWVEAGVEAGNGSKPPRVAILGEPLAGGPAAQQYADLPGLLEAIDAGAGVPEIVVASFALPDGEGDVLQLAHARAHRALQLLQAWLVAEKLAESRLCIHTAAAVAVAAGESPDLASAALWGLLRSAQSEHPGRFALIDSDGEPASLEALPAALGAGAGEPQIGLREGRMLLPRLARAGAEADEQAVSFDPESTILITGGTSGLGALLARHLVAEHGARHLLLASRRGAEAAGVSELLEELRGLGAEATASACDVADRAQLERLLGSIAPEHPLGAVVHSAGVVDDGLLDSLDAERLDRVFAAKVDAAWHLHELTAQIELSHFAMFSSVAGILGAPGQANYAAANSFLDALAARRRAAGLPAVSLAWGAWAQATGMTGQLGEADLGRVGRFGLAPMPPQLGLALFDAACAGPEPLLVPAKLDGSGLRAQAAAGTLPPILAALAGPARRAAERESLARRLAKVPEGERERVVLELVRGNVAAVLGHASAEAIDPESAFMDLGFDSLAAVELRNRLNAATGLRLPPTLVFDYPSTAAVAGYLIAQVTPGAGVESTEGPAGEAEDDLAGEDLAAMSHEEMFELIDEEFGAV